MVLFTDSSNRKILVFVIGICFALWGLFFILKMLEYPIIPKLLSCGSIQLKYLLINYPAKLYIPAYVCLGFSGLITAFGLIWYKRQGAIVAIITSIISIIACSVHFIIEWNRYKEFLDGQTSAIDSLVIPGSVFPRPPPPYFVIFIIAIFIGVIIFMLHKNTKLIFEHKTSHEK
jgi:hypothetical protein